MNESQQNNQRDTGPDSSVAVSKTQAAANAKYQRMLERMQPASMAVDIHGNPVALDGVTMAKIIPPGKSAVPIELPKSVKSAPVPDQKEVNQALSKQMTSPVAEEIAQAKPGSIKTAPVPANIKRAAQNEDLVEMSHPSAVGPVSEACQRILKILSVMGIAPNQAGAQSVFDFNNPDIHPVSLDVIMTATQGTEWWGWAPETMARAVDGLASMGMTISQATRDKLQAMACLHTTNQAWEDHRVFEKVTHALNGASPNFEMFEPSTPGMMAVSIQIMEGVNDHEYSPDAIGYMAVCCVRDGAIVFPVSQGVSSQVYEAISKIIIGDVSQEDYSAILDTWDQFSKNGISHIPPQSVDQLSEDDRTDAAIVRGYMIAKYAEEDAAAMKEQLASLALWAQAILRR